MARDHTGTSRSAYYELPEKWLGSGSIGSARFRHMIRDHIAASLGIEIDDFDLPPFSQQGGLGWVHQLFGAELPKVIEELNRELVA